MRVYVFQLAHSPINNIEVWGDRRSLLGGTVKPKGFRMPLYQQGARRTLLSTLHFLSACVAHGDTLPDGMMYRTSFDSKDARGIIPSGKVILSQKPNRTFFVMVAYCLGAYLL